MLNPMLMPTLTSSCAEADEYSSTEIAQTSR